MRGVLIVLGFVFCLGALGMAAVTTWHDIADRPVTGARQ